MLLFIFPTANSANHINRLSPSGNLFSQPSHLHTASGFIDKSAHVRLTGIRPNIPWSRDPGTSKDMKALWRSNVVISRFWFCTNAFTVFKPKARATFSGKTIKRKGSYFSALPSIVWNENPVVFGPWSERTTVSVFSIEAIFSKYRERRSSICLMRVPLTSWPVLRCVYVSTLVSFLKAFKSS